VEQRAGVTKIGLSAERQIMMMYQIIMFCSYALCSSEPVWMGLQWVHGEGCESLWRAHDSSVACKCTWPTHF